MIAHIVPKRIYFTIFAALMMLTGITVWAAFIDLGVFNDVIALSIALTKSTLVILYFMHVRHSSRLTWVFIAAGFIFLIILLVFTMGDFVTREWMGQPSGWRSGLEWEK
ncbi:MAG: cytochrome C oxidase subunit IV family protein [bacterium]